MTSPDAADLPNREQPRLLTSVVAEDPPTVDAADLPDANDDAAPVPETVPEPETAPEETAALEDALARAVRRAERARAKRDAATARAEKAAGRLRDVKAELRTSRKTVEKSAARVQREHDARERAERERAEWKQRAKTLAGQLETETARNGELHDELHGELQELRDALAADATLLENTTNALDELRAELEHAVHEQRAAADEAARLREQLLRLHTELGRVLPPRYLRRLGLG